MSKPSNTTFEVTRYGERHVLVAISGDGAGRYIGRITSGGIYGLVGDLEDAAEFNDLYKMERVAKVNAALAEIVGILENGELNIDDLSYGTVSDFKEFI